VTKRHYRYRKKKKIERGGWGRVWGLGFRENAKGKKGKEEGKKRKKYMTSRSQTSSFGVASKELQTHQKKRESGEKEKEYQNK